MQEYSLIHIRDPNTIQGIFLSKSVLGFLGIQAALTAELAY